MIPRFKVNVGGNDYEGELFTSITVKRRENNYDTAILIAENTGGATYGGKISKFDEIKVYLDKGVGYKQVFGGDARQLNPYRTPNGDLMQVKCKGYGAALEATNCKTEYGTESPGGINTCKTIWEDIVDNCINQSFGWDDDLLHGTGYAITKKIADFIPATKISYVNSPFKSCMDTVNLICDIATAIANGAAGPHFIIANDKNLIINTIGAHEHPDPTEWPDWALGTEANSDMTNADFLSFNTVDDSDEYANKVVLVTDFRKPPYDTWTQDSALWGSSGLAAFGTDTGLIGNSIKFTQNGKNLGVCYYPNYPVVGGAAWDVTKWGTTRTIPTVGFYFKKDINWDKGETASTGNVLFYTSAGNFFYRVLQPILNINDPVGEWVYKSIPFGPNATGWQKVVGGNWANINWIQFNVATVLGDGDGIGWIDDLHFTGQIARSAYNSTKIGTDKEHQKIFLSRYALDDTCTATDTGTAARLAKAELFRRQAMPYSIVFTVPLEPAMMAGQKLKVNMVTFRITAVEHNFSIDGATTTVSATSDLLNSHPVSVTDQYSKIMENIMVISKDAKDIRAGSEVDARLTPIAVNYP